MEWLLKQDWLQDNNPTERWHQQLREKREKEETVVQFADFGVILLILPICATVKKLLTLKHDSDSSKKSIINKCIQVLISVSITFRHKFTNQKIWVLTSMDLKGLDQFQETRMMIQKRKQLKRLKKIKRKRIKRNLQTRLKKSMRKKRKNQ